MEQGSAKKDSRQAYLPAFMLYCVLIAAIGAFSNGWVIGSPNVPGAITHQCANGNARIVDPKLPDCLPMGTTLWGFAVSSFCVGGLLAGLSGGYIQTKLGRKKTIILNTIPWIIGAILQGAAVDHAMFIVGRLIGGLSCGLGSVCIPTYIGEISTIKSRGAMGTCYQFFIVIGILLASVIGLPTATIPLWRLNYALVGIPAVFQLFMATTIVDSPRWLVSVGRLDEARVALQKLRGKNASIDAEFYEIVAAQRGPESAAETVHDPQVLSMVLSEQQQQKQLQQQQQQQQQQQLHESDDVSHVAAVKAVPSTDNTLERDVTAEQGLSPEQHNKHESMSLIGIFRDPLIRFITLLILSMHFTQQWIGMNAVIFYSTTIFAEAFDEDMSKYMAIATTGVNFVATMLSVVLIDKMGRRALFMLALSGCIVFSVLLVIGYRFGIPALLVVSVFLYVASFAIGIGPIPWMITSELCPTYASSAVSAAATCMNWSMNFVIGLVFPDIFAAIGGYSFLIFVGVGAVALVITATMLPETKNRSIENIVSSLNTRSAKRILPESNEKRQATTVAT